MMKLERWHDLMRALGIAANDGACLSLLAAYAEKHRHYHTAAHVGACLALLDACAAEAAHPEEIELALWFHDAVYKPLTSGNERKSAEWATRFLADNGAPAEMTGRVRSLILATAHDVAAETGDEQLLQDLDLAILGSDAATYAAYEAAIRKEYSMVPMLLYRTKRTEVLRGFLSRPRIYHHARIYAEREQQARVNLEHAIAQLGGSGVRKLLCK